MTIYCYTTSQVINLGYDYKTKNYARDWKSIPKDKDTWMLVINKDQDTDGRLTKLLEDKRIKVVYKSPMAVNRSDGHGTKPRNTLYIIEKADVEAS